ncbi:MAG: class I SAM-dependent methyltransferase [Syntrophorhabdaceae bacterium]
MQLGADGIHGYAFTNVEQAVEMEMRERIAVRNCDQLLALIAEHHSIPVMDCEVARLLRQIPENGWIIDVGGCWGWHWRKLDQIRPDVKVFIVDFVRANLQHAKALLGDAVNRSVFLVHGDATDLKFPADSFDCYWSVQALQHVVRFEKALNEARRVLKRGGIFTNYSLNEGAAIRWLYRIAGRPYVKRGWVEGSFWLSRASGEQKQMIESIFRTTVRERLSEILFKPELRASFPGREDSWLGRFDARLSNDNRFLGILARQRSFHCRKP